MNIKLPVVLCENFFILKPGSALTFSITDQEEHLEHCKNTNNNPSSKVSFAALIQNDGWLIPDDYPYKL